MSDVTMGTVTSKVTADTSQHDAAMKKSAEVVSATARANSQAKKKEAEAIAFAAKFAGDAVSEQSLRIVGATKLQIQAEADYRKARQLSRLDYGGSAEAAKLEAAALQRLTRAKLESAAASEVQHRVSDRMAASSVVRGLETGNVGIRSVENFLTTIPGASKVLQGLFSVIGPVAFAAAVVEGGMKIYELEQKGKHAGEELARAFGEMSSKQNLSNDELALTNSLLDDEYGKLTKHPTNGAETAILKGVVAAEKLQEALAGDLRALDALMKEHDVSELEGILSGVASTTGKGGSSDEISKYNKTIEKQGHLAQKAYADALRAAGEDHAKQESATKAYYQRMDDIAAAGAIHLRARAKDIADRQKELDAEHATAMKFSTFSTTGTGGPATDLTPVRSSFEDAAEVMDTLQRRAQLSGANLGLNEKVEGAKGSNEAQSAAQKAAEKRLKAMEEELDETKMVQNLTLNQERDFWAQRIAAFQHFPEQYDQVQHKLYELQKESLAKNHEILAHWLAEQKTFNKEMSEEAAKLAESDPMGKWKAENAKDLAARIDASNALSQVYIRNAAKVAEAETARKSGKSESGVAAATELANIHAGAYQNELAVLRTQLSAAESQKDGLGNPDTKKVEELQAKINDLQTNRNLQIDQDADRANLPDQTSAVVGAKDALNDLARAAQEGAAQMQSWLSSAIASTNSGIVKMLTEKQHRGDPSVVGAVGHNIFTSATGSLLKTAEGKALQAFGFGGDKAKPQHVLVDNFPGTGSGGLLGGGSGGSSGSSTASLLKLFGAGGDDDDDSDNGNAPSTSGGSGSGTKSSGNWFTSLLHGVIPGFADGVTNFGGGLAMVGEQGPEIAHLAKGTNIVPNGKLGSLMGGAPNPIHINVDASHSSDPAHMEFVARRAVMDAAPHIIAAANASAQERSKNRPLSAR
jgi:hypothetical protein